MFEYIYETNGKQLSLKDKFLFEELKQAVFILNHKEIDNWFKKLNLNSNDLNNLIKVILNQTYFFTFQTLNNENVFQKMNEQMKMVLPYFESKHYNYLLQNEFYLYKYDNEVWKIYFEKAKEEKKLKDFYSSISINKLIIELFHNENFERLEQIENIIQKKFNMIYTKDIPYFYEEKNSNGCLYLKLDKKINIKNMILWDYTDKKKEFYEKRKIKNISLEKINEIKELFNNAIQEKKQYYRDERYEYILKAITIYEKIILMMNLNKNLLNKNISKTKYKL